MRSTKILFIKKKICTPRILCNFYNFTNNNIDNKVL